MPITAVMAPKLRTNMSVVFKGIIIKAIAGFCYVEVGDKVYECKPRGFFRKDNITPVSGDRVEISVDGDKGVVETVFDRKNLLVRPPLANIDKLFIVSSYSVPSVNTLLIDRMVAIAEHLDIEPVILFNKSDLGDFGDVTDVYKKIGYKTFIVSAQTGEGIETLKSELNNSLSAFSGNSGVGKSSILNRLIPNLHLNTGEVSEKLGRGRHTTRQVELFKCSNGYVADTPGFSSLELLDFGINDKNELIHLFKEFNPHFGKCKFNSCNHINEPGCSVLKDLNCGEIANSRHESYVSMYNDLKDIKPWEINKK